MREIVRKLPAILLILIASIVMLGWWLQVMWLVRPDPSYSPQTFNAAFCLLLSGIALFFFDARYSKFYWLEILLGITIVIFAGLTLIQHIFGVNLGIDVLFNTPWFHYVTASPNRMATSTAVAFLIAGFIFILFPFSTRKTVALLMDIFIFIIFLIGLLALYGYLFGIEFLYSWYTFTQMSFRTTISLVILSIGLWLDWARNPNSTIWYQGSDDKKIILVSSMILLTITLLAGLTGFISAVRQQNETVNNSFQELAKEKINLIESQIANVYREIDSVRTNPLFQQLITNLSTDRVPLDQLMQLFIAEGFSAINFYNAKGELIINKGEMIANPDYRIMLNSTNHPILSWKNGWYLTVKENINHQRAPGYLIAEWPLRNISESLVGDLKLGKTAEVLICAKIKENAARCFPSRLTPKVFTMPLTMFGQPMPMSYALEGKSGTITSYDYRQKQVFAVYRRLGNSGLGLVLKMDLREIYAPVLNSMKVVLPVLLLAIIGGILLLRVSVMPLVKKLLNTELQLQTTNEQLSETQERYKLAVSGSQVGLWDWDINNDSVFYSDSFKKLLGYENADWRTREDFNKVLHPDDYNHLYAKIDAHLNKGEPFAVEYRLKTKNNDYRWFRAIGEALRDKKDNAYRMAGSIIDITERKKVDELKQEFISVVSHELRTPLTSIRGSLGLILGGAVGGDYPPKVKKLLEIANTNCERLLILINDILDIDKIEMGKMIFNLQVIDLPKLVAESVDNNQAYADKYSVKLEITKKTSGINVKVDPDRLLQVLANLLSNAAKFSPPGEKVSIEIEQLGDKVRVNIINKGEGIPAEFRARIFQKFSQADSSSTRHKSGSGLGLTISKAIIEKMGGEINFTSEPNVKTVFYFDLPLADEKNSTFIDQKVDQTTKLKILVCDDDIDQTDYLQLLLQNQGYKVDVANSAAEAKRLLNFNRYNVLLLDLILPDQDGISLIRELRQNKLTQKLPIIVISIIADTGRSLTKGDAFPIIDWLEKPVDLSKLVEAIGAIKHTDKHLPKILHIEDDQDVLNMVKSLLSEKDAVVSAKTLANAKEKLESTKFDLVILDLLLPDGNGIELFPLLAQKKIPIVVFSVSELDKQYSKYVSQTLLKSQTSSDDLVTVVNEVLTKKESPHD